MPNGTIDETKNSLVKDILSLVLVIVGIVMLLWGVHQKFGPGGVMIFVGIVMTALGVRLGLSRTGKE